MEEVADEPDEEDRSQSAPSAEEKKFAPDEESSSVVEGKPVPAETNTSLSRSMDEFVRTFRNRGNEKTSRPATNSSRSLSPTQGGSAESVSSDGSSTSHHGRNTSPQRLSRSSTTSWLSGVREGQPPQKRYMQMTESHSIARSLSPQATAAVDRSAVVWEYDNVALKPLWKKPNTYQSPCRAAQSSCSSSRANSTSPGARTAAALIDRLAKQDRSASGVTTAGGNADAPAAVSSSVDSGALRTSSQTQRSQVSLAANAAESSDAASVVSTSTTTSTSSSRKH